MQLENVLHGPIIIEVFYLNTRGNFSLNKIESGDYSLLSISLLSFTQPELLLFLLHPDVNAQALLRHRESSSPVPSRRFGILRLVHDPIAGLPLFVG